MRGEGAVQNRGKESELQSNFLDGFSANNDENQSRKFFHLKDPETWDRVIQK